MQRPERLAMFEVPDAARPLLPDERIFPADATWTAWKGAHRPCDVCGRLVLQMGMDKAPRPAAATWRRKGPNGEMFVCSPHQGELKPADDKVRAYLKDLRSRPAPRPAPRQRYVR